MVVLTAGKRAVRGEQKEARRQTILHAATALFADASFDDISMAEIARQSGIAKGTVYIYFKTKEEVFLEVLRSGYENSFDQLDRTLLDMPIPGSVPEVAQALAASLTDDSDFPRLAAITHSVLEQNVDYDTVLEFKQALIRRSVYTAGLLEERLPFLNASEGMRLLITAHALLMGLQPTADPAPVVAKIMERPEMAGFKVDSTAFLTLTLVDLMNGLANR